MGSTCGRADDASTLGARHPENKHGGHGRPKESMGEADQETNQYQGQVVTTCAEGQNDGEESCCQHRVAQNILGAEFEGQIATWDLKTPKSSA